LAGLGIPEVAIVKLLGLWVPEQRLRSLCAAPAAPRYELTRHSGKREWNTDSAGTLTLALDV